MHHGVVEGVPDGSNAHHIEYQMTTRELFANSFDTGETFVFDLTDPVQPTLVGSFGDAGPLTHPHSFARRPDGTVLATYQSLAADHDMTGGLRAAGAHVLRWNDAGLSPGVYFMHVRIGMQAFHRRVTVLR